MTNVRLLIFFSALFLVEATVNVCIPSHSYEIEAIDIPKLLKEIQSDISANISINANNPNLQFDHIDLDITHPAVRINGTLDNVSIYHLLNFRICFFENINNNTNPYKFDVFNITFTNLRVEGYYNVTGDLGDIFDIFGIGDFWVELRNLSVAMTDFSINVTDDNICFPINIDIDLQEIGNYFDNLMDDEELEDLFNRVITNIVPESLKIIWSEIKDIYDKSYEMNNIFQSHNVVKFLNILKDKENVPFSSYCYTNDDD